MTDTEKLVLIGLGVGVVAVGALVYAGKKASQAVAAVGTAVNPISDQNLAYKGVNAVGAAVTGDQSFSLGSWFYSFTHPNEAKDLGLLNGVQ